MKKTLTILAAALLSALTANAQNPNWQKQASASQQTPEEQKSKPLAYMVSNAHFDTQWNWDIQTSIDEYVLKTLDRNLFLLKTYPDYIFNFEGGVKYAFMKEYYPEKYEAIKPYIENGRWHISGSSWDATDANVPSPESLTRNILYGQHFYKQEFGVESTDIFLPDCFGFGWTLPTVAYHCGLIGFSTQKLQWREKPFYGESKVPFEIGLWQGIDGNRIMIICNALNYTKKFSDKDLSYNQELQDRIAANPLGLTYRYYGTGDRGGSGNLTSVSAVQTGVHSNGPVQILSAESDRIFRDYLPYSEHGELPVWDGELLMDVHGTGCYTSQAAMKRYNRLNENLADAAERSAVTADILGLQNYPTEFLGTAWKRFIWHQFHDDLTGTSIPRAYEFSWNDELICLQQFGSVLESSIGAISSQLNTVVRGIPVIIYNPLATPVSTTVEITVPTDGEYKVYNAKNKVVPSQAISKNKILVAVNEPGLTYSVYTLRKVNSRVRVIGAKACDKFENSTYAVTFDGCGDICSIVDKRSGKELVAKGKSIGLRIFKNNLSEKWPAWEIRKNVIDQEPTKVCYDVKIELVEDGPVRKTVRVSKKYGRSVFEQYISIYEGVNSGRIDIRNEVEWATQDALLKADFPLSFSASKARYDLGIGSVLRGTNTPTQYEVYAQKWADLTSEDGTCGVSILNDSKYGWDFPSQNRLRLTLLHTPSVTDRYLYQARQDLGHHSFTYSIISHEGDFVKAGTVQAAESLNQPVKAYTVSTNHPGTLGKSFTLASVDNANVVLKAFKKAEDGSGYVVRFYETSGKASKASISFAKAITSAAELNGNETRIGDASFEGKTLSFDIPAFGIKTFEVNFDIVASPAIVSKQVALEYNFRSATFNAFRDETNFDSKGNSYAAELLPRSLEYRGIGFNLAEPTFENAVVCKGQEIVLPEGRFNKVYFLAAAREKDVEATFKVGSASQTKLIPYYSGFIGQWGHTGHTTGYLKDAETAFVGTHKHNFVNKKADKDVAYEFTYMFFIAVDVPEGASTIELPNDENVVIFAATAVKDNSIAVPATDILRVGLDNPENK
ncbi:MAG: alpha-mannosidase [Bacteroidales bacterium]|nr:alpha-mannosidase [Bacteroidales bacterium]